MTEISSNHWLVAMQYPVKMAAEADEILSRARAVGMDPQLLITEAHSSPLPYVEALEAAYRRHLFGMTSAPAAPPGASG